jgi:putative IMPACT (imprinted ancient) family translation regulator
VPGLINAYKQSTQQALKLATIETRSIEKLLWLQTDYNSMNDVMQWIKHYQLKVVEKQIDLFCTFRIKIPLANEAEIMARFQQPTIEWKFLEE